MPHNREMANRLCLRGIFSILANIPTEDVFEIEGHACISLHQLLDRVFAQGTEFSFMQDNDGRQNYDGFNGTPRAQELLDDLRVELEHGEPDETFFGHLTFWSDSFLLCFSRQDSNSIWIFVFRIAAPEGESTSSRHTFCLAMGSSKESHDKVIAYYLKEVIELMKGKMRYYGKADQRKLVNTCFGLALYIADTPERNAILHRLHLGTFGLRSGYAGMVDPVGLPSCLQCYEHRLERLLNRPIQTQPCHNKCCDWD